MASGKARATSSHRSVGTNGLAVDGICCLLHNLIAGGSARQWIHLLGRHVEAGGRATIVAPPGPLSGLAEDAGIETVGLSWDGFALTEPPVEDEAALRAALAGHDLAVVHWDHGVMGGFETARAACGRVALTLHQTPEMLARWFGPEILPRARQLLERAIADPHAIVLVRGLWHRDRVARSVDLPEDGFDVLPPSIPIPPPPPRQAPAEPEEILALTRLSPEKAAIVQLASELVRGALDAGRRCRLTIAGAGRWRSEAASVCEGLLPPESWRFEDPPPDPYERLAAADLIVAQGLTTLEAAALERPVVVARTVGGRRAGGIALTPDRYDYVARDPFGRPPLRLAAAPIWREALGLGHEDLRALRELVERNNSLAVGSSALSEALARTA
jgi:hypothetical protein